eukprot:4819413-Amphidinium_carterae.2
MPLKIQSCTHFVAIEQVWEHGGLFSLARAHLRWILVCTAEERFGVVKGTYVFHDERGRQARTWCDMPLNFVQCLVQATKVSCQGRRNGQPIPVEAQSGWRNKLFRLQLLSWPKRLEKVPTAPSMSCDSVSSDSPAITFTVSVIDR